MWRPSSPVSNIIQQMMIVLMALELLLPVMDMVSNAMRFAGLANLFKQKRRRVSNYLLMLSITQMYT